MLDLLLDLVFPRRSLTGERGAFVTDGELARLTTYPLCITLPNLDRVVAAGTYARAPLLRKAIYTMKYGRIPGVAEKLGELLVQVFPLLGTNLKSEISNPKQIQNPKSEIRNVVLCPVPLHWLRRFSRGFNQAEVLSLVVSQRTGIPVQKLLKRIRPTGFQARRSHEERKRAVGDAFCVVPYFDGAQYDTIILVDDIATTGATLSDCARVLKGCGVQKIYGLVVAQG